MFNIPKQWNFHTRYCLFVCYHVFFYVQELLRPQVIIKSIKLINRKEVELKDANQLTYLLFFDSAKEAKIFIEDDKMCAFIENDNKLNIAQRLMKLLRRRESRDILERKGIYQNEPIFGNTLKIYLLLKMACPGSSQLQWNS